MIFMKTFSTFSDLSWLMIFHRAKFLFCIKFSLSRQGSLPLNLFFNFPTLFFSRIVRVMYIQKASPARSMKSGSSVTSSTNSVRSTPGSSQSQARSAAVPVPKARVVPSTTPKSAVSSNQSSFEEDTGPIAEGLVRCGICKRNFAEDRIETHHIICQKNKTKKRRVYDASKKRVQVRFLLDWITL